MLAPITLRRQPLTRTNARKTWLASRLPGVQVATSRPGPLVETLEGRTLLSAASAAARVPTATIRAADVTQPVAGYVVDIDYVGSIMLSSIDVHDITVAGPSGALAVTGVTTAGANRGNVTASYAVAPPGGSWDAADDGTYTVSTVVEQIDDTNGESVAPTSAQFHVNIGAPTGPSAVISATDVTAAGATTEPVQVVFNDTVPVSVASIGTDDITVTGAGGPLAVTAVTSDPTIDAPSVVAVYQVAPPGGTWDAADNGTYTISLPAGAVADTSARLFPAAGAQFTVNVTPPGPSNGPDLVIAAVTGIGKAGLPPSVVGGAKGAARVQVSNQGNSDAAGLMAITLVARDVDPATPAAGDTPILTTPEKPVRLKTGQTRFFAAHFTYPNLPAAAYEIVAVADSGNTVIEANEANNEGASTPITIAPAFVDLTAVAVGAPARGAIPVGRRVSAPVTVEDVGNAPATGLLKIDLYASTTGDTSIDENDLLIGSVTKHVHLKPGKPRVIRITVPVQSGLAAGQYFLTAMINNPPAIAEASTANNTAVSTSPSPAA